jgi:DNA invertase Pin-like site-specific DNA recombinase
MHEWDKGADAYSYRRFSFSAQERGDSLRRQAADAEAWSERTGIVLDANRVLIDRAASAFTSKHRSNPDRFALAAFLEKVERGKVRPGSYLVLESLDRLTREEVMPALGLCISLLTAGIRIVQLKPVEMVYGSNPDPMHLMMMIMELSRGNSESKLKSDRVGESWVARRAAAREGRLQPTGSLPGWLVREGDDLAVKPGAEDTIRRIFRLVVEGQGLQLIVQCLTRERVPCFGTSGKWNTTYVASILNDRRVLGEWQPRTAGGQPDGDPIPGYFPAVVPEVMWDRTRHALGARRRKGGRAGNHINLFAHLLRDAKTGSSFVAGQSSGYAPRVRALSVYSYRQGLSGKVSFRADVFERCFLAGLAEVRPDDVLQPDGLLAAVHSAQDRLTAVQTMLATVREVIRQAPSRTASARAAELEIEEDALLAEVAAAQRRAATPTREAWDEQPGLVAMLDRAEDRQAARLALRACLRRTLSEIRMLVVPRGQHRLALVQAWFIDGVRSRMWLVHWRPARANGSHRSPAIESYATYPNERDVDLRKPSDVAALEADLLAAPLS